MSYFIQFFQAFNLRFSVESPKEISALPFLARLPGFSRVDSSQPAPSLDFAIRLEEAPVFSCVALADQETGVPWDSYGLKGPLLQLINDAPHLCYALARAHWINEEFYPIHSCGFGSWLAVGHSGSGKTALALEFLRRGYAPWSFDKTLARFETKPEGRVLAPLAGTPVCSVREPLANPEKLGMRFEHQSFGKNIYSLARPVGVFSPHGLGPNTIKGIALARLSDQPLRVQNLAPQSALHELHPFFLDRVKESVLLGGGATVLNFSVTQESEQTCADLLRAWLMMGPAAVEISGSAEAMADWFMERLNG